MTFREAGERSARDWAKWQIGEDLAFGLEVARTSVEEGGAQSEVRVSISR